MPWHGQKKLGKAIFFFLWRFTLTFVLIVLAVSSITIEVSERLYKTPVSFATKIFICDYFPLERKNSTWKLKVLPNVKQRARFLAGMGRSYLGIGSDVSGPYCLMELQWTLISAFFNFNFYFLLSHWLNSLT